MRRRIGALVDEWLTDHVAVAVAVHDDVNDDVYDHESATVSNRSVR
jgi:hypothetical protein